MTPPDAKDIAPTLHRLKTWPEFYMLVVAGAKRFEIRKNDRDFHVGDVLLLEEYQVPHASECDCGCKSRPLGYTGRALAIHVTSVLFQHDGLLPGYVIMGIEP